MKISEGGARALGKEEGLRLKAYKDTVGVLTIGYGHTGRMSPPKVTPGMVITEREAVEYLHADLAPTEAAVNAKVKVPITQSMYDALVSFTFNVGVGAFTKSTLLRKLNAGAYGEAADQFLVWVKQPELKGRRERERSLFLKDGVPGPIAGKLNIVSQGPTTRVRDDEGDVAGWTSYPGASNPGMEKVQQRLIDLDYKIVGTADGFWGNRTIAALAEFRAVNDIPDVQADLERPRIDKRTLDALFDNRALHNVISEARANATTAEVQAKVPNIMGPAIVTRLSGKLATAATGIGAAVVGTSENLGESWDKLSAVKSFITSPWVLGSAVLLLALFAWYRGRAQASAVKEGVRDGAIN